ncbi:MAG: aminomethyl-transferring glycine dehydrogenase subunit GcvPA [Candidatus Hodarchaeota archaeon]
MPTKYPYIPISHKDQKKMLEEMGIDSLDSLFADIPNECRLKAPLNLPPSHSEIYLRNHVQSVALYNQTDAEMLSFLGGGVWSHHVPALVDAITGRDEFLSAYTPYQPEVSQGSLQSLFEYQSLIGELFDLPIVNNSMYDWATALGEAARMCQRVTRKNDFLIPQTISPERRAVLETYTRPIGMKIIDVSYDPVSGLLNLEDLSEKLSPNIAGVYIENPTYFGYFESQIPEIVDMTHKNKSLFVLGVDPTCLGVVRSPGDLGADIAVAEGQPFGGHPTFGGHLLGIFAVREDKKFIRQFPGRVIGATLTKSGEHRGYVMTLQTREQHIRREKATSNICTNHALNAIGAAVYLALLGKQGLYELGKTLLENSHYLQNQLQTLSGIKVPKFINSHFKEFVIDFKASNKSVSQILEDLLDHNIFGGISLESNFSELKNCLLVCTTEVHTKEDLDQYITCLGEVLEE